MSRYCFLCSALMLLLSGCSGAPPASIEEPDTIEDAAADVDCTQIQSPRFDLHCEVTLDGADRSFWVTLPKNHTSDGNWPLVLLFHGAYSNAEQQTGWTGFADKARRDRFVLIAPSGLGVTFGDGGGYGFWNGGRCCTQVDDVAFVARIVEYAREAFGVDAQQVFASGISNGGFMSFRLACDLNETIAAIAVVAAQDMTTSCTMARAIPVLQIHGTQDMLLPYGGGSPQVLDAFNPLINFSVDSVTDTIKLWAGRNDCSAVTEPTFQSPEVDCFRYPDCADGAEVEHCRIIGGGHTWPDWDADVGDLLGHTTTEMNATDYIWDFFEAAR